MSMLAGNSMESENSDGTGDFPTETCRRLRAECQRMMARLIGSHDTLFKRGIYLTISKINIKTRATNRVPTSGVIYTNGTFHIFQQQL